MPSARSKSPDSAAVVDAGTEILRLESELADLRDRIDSLNFEKQAASPKAAAHFSGEIRQPHETITAQCQKLSLTHN